MPTRKDKTNVAPIYREQVFIPASGATLMKQKARPKVAGRPVSSGAIDIVSPEFDILTGVRGLANLPKAFLRTNKLPKGENLYYRQLDKSSKGLERAKEVGVIDTKSSGGVDFVTSTGSKLRLGKTFDTPFFAKGSLWYNNVDDMDVIVGKDNPLLDWKMITQHGRVTENAAKAGVRRTPFYNEVSNQAPTKLFEMYRRYPLIGYRNVTNGFPTMPITGLNTAVEQMKCGGRRKAQLGLDIREGGIAVPIAPNMYYMQGRSHDEGGIGIGPNNKNGLEVEGGEVVKVGNNDIKVFSGVPLLRGVSPAQLVMGGANPNAVFKAQEEFKDKNRINDDGTMYKSGGIYIKPNKRGTFTAAATKHGMSVQGFASKVLANKEDYSSAMIKKANFARNASRWKKEYGGEDDTKTAVLKRLRNKFTITGDYGGGMFGGAGAGSVIMKQPEFITDTITKRYLVPVTQNFNDAFGDAVNAGLDKFMFDKKWYTTEKSNNPNNNAAGAARTQTIYLPVEHKEVRRRKKEYGGSMIYTINGNIKNGLMSARPKAQYGTIKRHGKIWKWDEENGAYVPTNNSEEKVVVKNNKADNKTTETKSNKNYTINGTFDNARPQYYAEKRLPIAGGQSIAEKAGLARSGWSYGKNPTVDYVPNINISVPINYAKAVGYNSKKSTSSTPRGRVTKTSTPKSASQSTPTIQDTVNKIAMDAWKASKTPKIDLSKVEMPKFDISRLESKKTKEDKAKLNTPSTGGGTQSKDGRWVGQYKTTNAGDWIGLGSNVLGSLASYFITKNAINKMPNPVKPVMAQAAKLKTKYNVEPQLSEIREAEEMNRAAVRRNTQSSNTSLAREQRLMNEARGARNTLYGQKENIETQLINQDRLNRQSVMRDNVRTYNEYLNKLTATKMAQNEMGVSNINNLISGLTGSVNNILGTIESRRATNNTLRAIAAANPNVDARLIGGFDYYIDPITKKKYNKNQQYVGTING